MKYLFSVLLLLSATAGAQPIALLHVGLKRPIAYSDSVSLQTLSGGVFPVYVSDAAPLLNAVETIRKKMARQRYETTTTDRVRIGHSVLTVHTETHRRLKKCTVSLGTEAAGFTAYMDLVNGRYDRAAQQRIVLFLDYLRSAVPATAAAVPAKKKIP